MWGSALAVGVRWPESSSSVRVGRVKRRRRPAVVVSDVQISLLPLYFDCGDASRICRYCGAFFWYDERISKSSGRVVYSRCCREGKVVLPGPLVPPSSILGLYNDGHFMHNIRAYNAMFSMTSFGAKIDESLNVGRAPYTFKVSGQISHWIGSLCPDSAHGPRFLQLYLYDTLNEVENRLRFYGNGEDEARLRPDIVAIISQTLSQCNEYVRTFKRAVDIAEHHNLEEYAVRLYNNVPDVRYGLPQAGTLGAILVADDANASSYDIIVRSKNGRPHRISKLHQSYMPLQYPLLFPFGEQGWSPSLRRRGRRGEPPKSLTVNKYYSYLLHDRYDVFTLLLRGGRLLQQFILDAYLCVEDSRLDYFRKNQGTFRTEFASGVYDALSRGDSRGKDIGKRVFLPSSFVGGPRYMYKHYQDALALCRVYGKPQYFITFTCNARWPEILRFMDSHTMGHPQNRPDIISRIFNMKVRHFIDFLKEERPFGRVTAYLYTIEFQKRGLPHCHTLLWVDSDSIIRDAEDVDKYISAELPDPVSEPLLYSTITNCMIHGPCGLANVSSPCMKDGVCKKRFPKPFSMTTFFDKDGYVHYKRNEVQVHTLPTGVEVHNGFVVPYNKLLCSRFNAHINVEYCGWNMMIKYLFKYISKGVERVTFALHKADSNCRGDANSEDTSVHTPKAVDEIENFVDGRYICPHESAWRLFNFSIHERVPAVQVLAVHLENQQNVTFREDSDLQQLVRGVNFGNSTLSRWMVSNRWDKDGRHLTYVEYCSMFVWRTGIKDWRPRTKRCTPAVGRLVYVHSASGELFFLRMLLCHQKGCRFFVDIRTVNGVVYSTYRLACEALGLVGDDKEWLTAFIEASSWASSSELRYLFCNLLLFCEVGSPKILWEHAWVKMGDDIMRSLTDALPTPDSVVSEEILKQHILFELEKILNAGTPTKSLISFGLPLPSSGMLVGLRNRLLMEETLYNTSVLQQQHVEMSSQLNSDQLRIYHKIRTDYGLGQQSLIFVYGHGGTGKTFLWSTILAYFRSIGKIILAVASSGIASLLLPNGRTAHSRFNMPIDLSDTSVCDIKKRTQLSQLLEQTSAIIWDEATMMDRWGFECVDRSLRDILGKPDKPFGGISMLLGGDFRQTLPVKKKKTHMEIMRSTLPNSYLWQSFIVYKLSRNMRLSVSSKGESVHNNSGLFAQWLLDVGNGVLGEPDQLCPQYVSHIRIPDEFLIKESQSALRELIDFVYGSNILHHPSPEILCGRAIVCPKNCTTNEINATVLEMTPGDMVSYYSTDTITPHTRTMADLSLLYPEEYLNQLNFPGLPLHKLELKKNVPILLLRNLNQRNGLCNGTRLIVTAFLPTVIEAVIITGTCIGRKIYLPRIKFIYNDPELPFSLNRKQFPCKVCYAMTINKSQGQSLQRIGVYLPLPIFSHGQLYVAFSRAVSPDAVKVLILDENGKSTNTTKNIVYKDFLQYIDYLEIDQ